MILFRQVRYQLMLFFRRPAAMFFVIIMPVVLLALLTQILGNEAIPGEWVSTAQFYTPALAVFGVVSACYIYLAVSTATSRDQGVLKRIRGTPLSPTVYMTARIISVSIIAFISAIIVIAAGVYFLDVEMLWEKFAAGCVILFVGGLTFAALGLAVTAMCRSSETVQAVVNATLLPLAFLSEIFIRPGRELPDWMVRTADFFPLKHFGVAFGNAFRPSLDGHGFSFGGDDTVFTIVPELTVMAIWGIAATLVAVRFFKWDYKL